MPGDLASQPAVLLRSPGPLAAADVNNDGNIDMVTAGFDGNEFSSDLGNGDGTFQPAIFSHDNTLYIEGLVVQDFNNDGIQDLAAANRNSRAARLVRSTSGSVNAARASKSASEYRRTQSPGPRRPHRPLR